VIYRTLLLRGDRGGDNRKRANGRRSTSAGRRPAQTAIERCDLDSQ
jgi:hypothetical protein